MSKVSLINNLKSLTSSKQFFTQTVRTLRTPRGSKIALSMTGGALLTSGLISARKHNYSVLLYNDEGPS